MVMTGGWFMNIPHCYTHIGASPCPPGSRIFSGTLSRGCRDWKDQDLRGNGKSPVFSWIDGKFMGNSWEIHGKCMGNAWEMHGKCWCATKFTDEKNISTFWTRKSMICRREALLYLIVWFVDPNFWTQSTTIYNNYWIIVRALLKTGRSILFLVGGWQSLWKILVSSYYYSQYMGK